jgi:hypothetical protein
MKKIHQHGNDLPDLLPDIIPEEKKPLDEPYSENNEDPDEYEFGKIVLCIS